MKSINKLVCIMLLIFGIGAASDGNFVTAGLFAFWPCIVLMVSLIDSTRKHGLA